jgi:hypothetical protein
MPAAACPSCGRPLRVPEHLAGRQVLCPACGEIVPGPTRQAVSPEAPADDRPDRGARAAPPWPLPARLGVTSLALGLASVPVLCVPVVGYAALALSGLGLLLALGGLLGALARGARAVPGGGAGGPAGFGARGWDYPLAGLAACLLALALALLPLLGR